MRFAFFGGSFDPPHLGHLGIALAACDRLGLDQVLLAPVGRQPLKSHEPAPFADRLAMLTLLTAGYPQLAASTIDEPVPGGGPNYTVATLARLRATLPPGAELYLLAGADSFLTLSHWHQPQALLAAARPASQRTAITPEPAQTAGGALLNGWILAARPGFPLASLATALPPGYTLGPAVASGEPEDPAAGAGPVLAQQVYTPAGAPATTLYLLPDLDDPSTATRIREALAEAYTPALDRAADPTAQAPHLTPAIAQYIRDHKLYKQRERVLG